MIHIVLGTKAQLIKMAPIMRVLKSKNIPYNFIFTGQHNEGMDELQDNLGIKKPDTILYKGKDITSPLKMFIWSVIIITKSIFIKDRIFKKDKKGIVLVHGDTVTTLLGALMGKFAGLKVGHVEAGLRSFDFFHPFPEEIVRVLTTPFSDYYFCPGQWALNNLSKYKGKKINTFQNTIFDAFQLAIEKMDKTEMNIPKEKYCLVSIHRYENIVNKKKFEQIIEIVEKVAKNIKCIFVLHPITEKKLYRYNLYLRLKKNPGVELQSRLSYLKFIKLVYHSEFMISDGGSNQEECSYLGKPCLLLRQKTERLEGINRNVCLSEMDDSIIDNFLKNYKAFKAPMNKKEVSPSGIIVDEIKRFA